MKLKVVSIIMLFLIFEGCQSLVYHHKITKETPRDQKAYVGGLAGVTIAGVDEDSIDHLDTVFVSPGAHSYRVKLTTNSGRGSAITFKYNTLANSTNIICPNIDKASKSWILLCTA